MTSDGRLVVNFGALQQAGADLHKAVSTLQDQLAQLESDAAPLVATWEGEAQLAYAQRQAKWRSAAEDLQHILRDIKVAVDDSASDYLHTEKKATSLFQ
jgi:WXG100 family type VII secretion target